MSVVIYTRNQPVAANDLDISQPFLATNTNSADTIFGKDHYAFSNLTTSQGLHNTVTTPAYVVSPATNLPPVTTNFPIFYAYLPLNTGTGMPTTNLPLMQYSRGVNDTIPTPLTNLQSQAGALAVGGMDATPVFDFAGINLAIANFYAFNYNPSPSSINAIVSGTVIFFNGVFNLPSGPGLGLVSSGTMLELKNTTASNYNFVFWTLSFERIQ
jgi:hypothetical protein